ncbi:hypothetical protein [Pseudocnuella soli]|uniref:hypothetical protein n=1 Tax=Pseudocnuella soli TaxID=2502779 RepID=UPI001044CE5A|nr:hypothetical protein [Pseudocnuella soli]
MGVGRKEFLRLSGLALAGVAVAPLNAVVINDNAYVNKKLGILFYKPQDWGFVSVKEFGKIKSEQIIGEGLDQTVDEIWEDLGDPVCVATKYYQDLPENKYLFSPTITFNATPKAEIDELGFETFEELIGMSEYGVSKILKKFRVTKRYDPYLISGCKIYEFDAEYLFEHINFKKPIKVELKTLKAEHNGFYYDFNCHQSKAQNQLADKEFDYFKKSIRLI